MRRPKQNNGRIYQRDLQLHGSAHWASPKELAANGFGTRGRLLLGYGLLPTGGTFPITYNGAKHGLTSAPTRSGKAVSSAVPAMLCHPGPIVVVDPKGEHAMVTARYRKEVLGHNVYILDPYNIACRHLGIKPARFNVLDWVDPASDDFIDDALLVADALVMTSARGDPFWTDEARALVIGFILYASAAVAYVKTDPKEVERRNLGRVRELLNLDGEAFTAFIDKMKQSPNEYVQAAAGRISNKADKERASVISTAQQNTHFLEGPRIRESLSASDFDFRELENGKTDIYLILPADKLRSHSRWLRLMLNIAITAITRFAKKPDPPVYFLLEEMGALGRLEVIESAYGLMAGYGMQLHAIVQDFSQLRDLYGERWQSFIANSGFIQCFGTGDPMTAEYISKLCGVGTVESLSENTAITRTKLFADPHYLSREDMVHQRALVTPDEVMSMHPACELLQNGLLPGQPFSAQGRQAAL